MAIIKTISDLLWGMPLIVLILLAGIIFTVGSKFFQIAHLKHILKNTALPLAEQWVLAISAA